MSSRTSIFFELRRRRVFRGIGLYLVGAWTLLQVTELVSGPLDLPSWSLTALLYLEVVAFPIAVWVAWRYELTEQGFVRTRTLKAGDSTENPSPRVGDYLILAALLVVVGLVGWNGLTTIRTDAENERIAADRADEAERMALENSVAVLPFSELGRDGGPGFLGDGIADTVLHVLGQVDGLTVSARTSSFAFRDRPLTIEQIARELGVAHVLEGSVQRAGNQLRIIARLVDARNGRELWSGNFDRAEDEIFAVQDEIAREVVAALQPVVLSDDRERLADAYRPDLQAYEQYVLGLRELDAGSVDSAVRAIAHFERAIELDPDYALPHAMLAQVLQQHAFLTHRPPAESEQRIADLVERSLQLDPALAEAWSMKSALEMGRKEFEKAEASILKALDLNPNSAHAWAGYWNWLLMVGRQEEALTAIRRAVELDPESARLNSALASQLFRLGRAEEAIAVLRENLRRHPENARTAMTLARFLNQFGKPVEAALVLDTQYRRDPENSALWMETCMQAWHLWDLPTATECFDEFVAAHPENLEAGKYLAWARKDNDEALRLGEIAVERFPTRWYPKMQLSEALAQSGDWARIIDLLGEAFPRLLEEDPKIDDMNQWPARRLAEALLRTGREEQGRRLIERILDHFDRSRKLQAGGWMAGPEDALLHALLGNDERALDILEEAIEDGWMFYSWSLFRDTALDPLRETPRFQALLARFEARLATHRERLAEERATRTF